MDIFKGTCSHPGCKNGVIGESWPVKNCVDKKVQAYWCKFASEGLCQTIFCSECGELRLLDEAKKFGNKSNSRSKRDRRN